MKEKNCWTCVNRHFGWNDDYIDGDYHDWICDINGSEGILLNSNDYSKKKAQQKLEKMGISCKDWHEKTQDAVYLKKQISDEFEIKIGEDWRSKSGFICASTRKGAKLPEPLDDHRIPEWIIGEFRLKHFKNYHIKVTATLLDAKKEK